MHCLQQQLLNGRIVAFAVERMLGVDEIRAASTDKRRACSTRDKYASDGHNPQLATAHGDKSFSISLFSAQVIGGSAGASAPACRSARRTFRVSFWISKPKPTTGKTRGHRTDCRVGGAADDNPLPPPPSTFPCTAVPAVLQIPI